MTTAKLRPSQVYDHLGTKMLRPGYYLVSHLDTDDFFIVHRGETAWEAVKLDPGARQKAPLVSARTKHELMETLRGRAAHTNGTNGHG